MSLEVLNADPENGQAWHVLAIAQEAQKAFATAISCYEAAVALLPGNVTVLLNLSRLALTMDMTQVAEALLRNLLTTHPDSPEAVNNLSIALNAQGRGAEAIEVLREFLARRPGNPNLLNTLGSLVADSGDPETANLFLEEAARLAPALAAPVYNLGDNHLVLGRPAEALECMEAALSKGPPPEDRPAMLFSRSLAKLALGDLKAGWIDYEARNDPNWPGFVLNLRNEPRWRPGDSLVGRRLLVIGEQGLGDEVMFAGLVPDVLDALGEEGRLILAVEPRLIGLLSRSFPQVQVIPHRLSEIGGRQVRQVEALPDAGCDFWTPIASLLQVFRPDTAAFQREGGYLRVDPDRVGRWREALQDGPPGPRVGLLWKSAVLSTGRHRVFAGFEAWEPILRTPGVVFVNLQYGDCEPELELARSQFKANILSPRGIDLKQDLEEVATLACALDLTVGFSNASFNLAAAAGAPAWLVAAKRAWTTLGTDAYPWYPQVRVYQPDAYAEWEPLMARIAADLSARFRGTA